VRLRIHGRPETEEDGFVGERPKLMAVDRCDQEVDGVRPEVDRRAYRRSVGHEPWSGSLDGAADPSFDADPLSDDSSADAVPVASGSAEAVSAGAGGAGATGEGSGGGGGLTGRTPGSGADAGDMVDAPDAAGVTDGCGDGGGVRSGVRDVDGAELVVGEAVDRTVAPTDFGGVGALAGGDAFGALAGLAAAGLGALAAAGAAASSRAGSGAPDPASSRILAMIEATSVAAAAASRSRLSSFSRASSTWRIRLSAVARARSRSLVSFWSRLLAFFGADAVAALAAATTSSAAEGIAGVTGVARSCPFERLRSVRLSAIASSWVRVSGVRSGA
jgi:hypothetical protein